MAKAKNKTTVKKTGVEFPVKFERFSVSARDDNWGMLKRAFNKNAALTEAALNKLAAKE